MKTFQDLEFSDHPLGSDFGIRSTMKFDNGYGISVVRSQYIYGGDKGLYEIAVLDYEGHITYTTPITDDVIGSLTEDDVTKIMEDIQKL